MVGPSARTVYCSCCCSPACPQPTLEKSNKVAAANYSTPGTDAPAQYPTSAVRKAKDWSKVDQELAVGAGGAGRRGGAAVRRVIVLYSGADTSCHSTRALTRRVWVQAGRSVCTRQASGSIRHSCSLRLRVCSSAAHLTVRWVVSRDLAWQVVNGPHPTRLCPLTSVFEY